MNDGAKAVPRIVVVSGPVGAGKSTLAQRIAHRYGAVHIRTSDIMRDLAITRGESLPGERRAMQDFGDRLDTDTGCSWVSDWLSEKIADGEISGDLIVIDAARRATQIERLRDAYPMLTHIHVHAPEDELSRRYSGRVSGLQELENYAEVRKNATEEQVTELADEADVSIDTQRCTIGDVEARAAAALRLPAPHSGRYVDVLVGGQYGSEGKGNVAYYLAPDYDVLMRVGGPNAGHKVPTTPEYTHRLLPSGTLANPDALLVIGPGATLDLDVLNREIADCQIEVGRLFIDPQAMIIEAEDLLAEQALKDQISSTGKGGGAAAARRIMGRRHSEPAVRLARDVEELAPFTQKTTAEVLEDAFRAGKKVLLEGTQGTALSLYHGDYPHVTSRDTTTNACLAEAGIGPHRLRRVVMVVRTYPIRVGNSSTGATSGPMSQEIDWAVIAQRSGLSVDVLRGAERGSVSGTARRVGEFDWQLLKRAAELNGATDIALTFSDYLDAGNKDARRYNQLDTNTIHFIEEVERVAGAPVSLIGTRFHPRSVIDRREW
ncbi:adenylosuccinate synthase [Mycolicibacterium setense]|uniref:adenylosuccinate synthetase n=1 Tax=Mycolicibacterium setense TaxID=431269 RepID=UPI0007EC0D53|nr:adenylosuccinate synthetase [Mycolicibacterium setense]OBB17696.1 adenylosuccinate synthase [Mycolicibacterium setense]